MAAVVLHALNSMESSSSLRIAGCQPAGNSGSELVSEYIWRDAMLPEKFLRVLQHEGVVAIATQGTDGEPHLVNTWNSYIQITRDEHLLIPAGGMHKTEKNLSQKNLVLLTAGSRDVEGKSGAGAGFLIRGNAEFLFRGADFDLVRSKFPWARAALKVMINHIAQTL